MNPVVAIDLLPDKMVSECFDDVEDSDCFESLDSHGIIYRIHKGNTSYMIPSYGKYIFIHPVFYKSGLQDWRKSRTSQGFLGTHPVVILRKNEIEKYIALLQA